MVDVGENVAVGIVKADRQTVVPFDGSEAREFEADFNIVGPGNRASGVVDYPFSLEFPEQGSYNAFFGAVFKDEVFGGEEIFAVGVRGEPSDPLDINDTLLASATEDPFTDEDCLIWDLLNGSTGEVNNAATFDADTAFKTITIPIAHIP